jgi:dTDP-4-dehydrorhamnose reductase
MGSDKSVLITGAGGLLGRIVSSRFSASGWNLTALGHAQLDVTNQDAVTRTLNSVRPDLVVNCAATTDVDRCESDPDWAARTNVEAPRLLARLCRTLGSSLVHISTDYVFDGEKEGLYTQEDQPNPLSVYGETKLMGEFAVQEELDQCFVVRTSWIFGPGGKNFGSRVLDYARRGDTLKAVIDQTSIPTFAPDLSARIEEVISRREFGLYHITNSNPGTWFEFARLVLNLAGMQDVPVNPIKRADLNQPAVRPRNSGMRCLLSEKLGLAPLRDWRETLPEFAGQVAVGS